MTIRSDVDHLAKAEAHSLAVEPAQDNPLSDREMDVARLLATGLSNAEIARELVISPHTVKVHLRNIFDKLQVNSRTEASMVLLQRGWIVVPGMAPAGDEADGAAEPPIPEPEPLFDLPAQVWPWQRLYLVAVLTICIVALVLPNLRSRGATMPELLSDGSLPIIGKPVPDLYPRWDVRTPMNTARSRLGVVRVGEQLYVIGGEAGPGQTLATVDVYDLTVNDWSAHTSLPVPLANLAVATEGGQIYVAGGSTALADGSIQVQEMLLRYDPAQDSWEELGALPTPLAGAQLVSDELALYLLGGWDGKVMHDEVWRYVPQRSEQAKRSNWELMTRLPAPMAFFGAVTVGDDIYVVGGYDGHNELAAATTYSLINRTWRELPPLSAARGGLSVVYDGMAIFALGGGWTRTLDTLERYDPGVGVWSNFPSPMPGEWRHLGAAAYNDRLHLIGGWSGDYMDIHLQYQSTFRALLPVITND